MILVCVCTCVFIKLHITTQSDPVIILQPFYATRFDHPKGHEGILPRDIKGSSQGVLRDPPKGY